VAREAPVLSALFAEFGLEVHVKQPGQTDPSKSVVLFYPKPARCYANKETFDGVDLTDIDINGQSVTVVEEAKYLGSYAARAGNDLRDVEARIDKAQTSTGQSAQAASRAFSPFAPPCYCAVPGFGDPMGAPLWPALQLLVGVLSPCPGPAYRRCQGPVTRVWGQKGPPA
jgi:hypothetical protein